MIVGIAGRRGSGKTTLAKVLKTQHGFRYAAFGDVVRAEARLRGQSDDVDSLQHLGATLIAEWGWVRFCDAVVPEGVRAEKVVVEGIRHRGAADGLRVLAGGKFILVFVDLPDEERGRRLDARAVPGEGGLASDHGVTELEVESLRAMSDLIVDGRDLEAAALHVARFVAQRES